MAGSSSACAGKQRRGTGLLLRRDCGLLIRLVRTAALAPAPKPKFFILFLLLVSRASVSAFLLFLLQRSGGVFLEPVHL